ncbi:MAG: hypothetical protein J6M91_08220 [Methanobrevibacter sp.]|nr:hypothetical protein [Methanobrevibacter sp.]
MEQKEQMLKVEEVAVLIGSSIYTIRIWYKWKKLHPEHELAKLLPDYYQSAPRQTRYWKRSDIWKLIEFKSKLPKGHVGIMGDVTQVWWHKQKEKQNESSSKTE